MAKYLSCVRSGYGLVEGKRYKVAYEDKYAFYVDRFGHYTKEPDSDGLSYRNWFVLESDENGEDEELTNITVLKDETIGNGEAGVEREYREVKRKAGVGERIKIVKAQYSFGDYNNGDVLTVRKLKMEGFSGVYTKEASRGWSGGFAIDNNEYVVLEPTDIVRVGGVRYRLVERKATEGERIIFAADWKSKITAGKVYDVYACDRYGGEFKDDRGVGRWQCLGNKPKSYVLEPLTTKSGAVTDETELLVLQRQLDAQAARISELETKTADLTDKVSEMAAQLRAVSEVTPRVPETATEVAPLTRDDIVTHAKEDVAKLLAENYVDRSIWFVAKDGYVVSDRCEFVVNREKRTVVALIKGTNAGLVHARGTAKAAPGDCFNVHIGKAIALRRALALPIPNEYVNAPQPTEPRVGDVVTFPLDDVDGWYGKVTYEVISLDDAANLRILTSVYDQSVGGVAFGGDLRKGLERLVIYDDSRCEVSE